MGSLVKLRKSKSAQEKVTAIRRDGISPKSKLLPTPGEYSALARDLNVSASYVSLIFSGKRTPSAATLFKIAKHLKMRPDRLHQELMTLQGNHR